MCKLHNVESWNSCEFWVEQIAKELTVLCFIQSKRQLRFRKTDYYLYVIRQFSKKKIEPEASEIRCRNTVYYVTSFGLDSVTLLLNYKFRLFL